MIVRQEVENVGLHCVEVELGRVIIEEEVLTPSQRDELISRLQEAGLELMQDKNSILIERIKNVIIEMIHYNDGLPSVNYSQFISDSLNYSYTYLSNLFSSANGTTIQQFIIKHKIEKVKEMLIYEDVTLTEVAYKMQYSSVAHLSKQFKEVTGMTPTEYRSHKKYLLNNLEDL
jgi:AraC-like DNA-binding protein